LDVDAIGAAGAGADAFSGGGDQALLALLARPASRDTPGVPAGGGGAYGDVGTAGGILGTA
jgi:hypothetical protein